MKTLLVGPYPPPHGGISVHVRGLEKRAIDAGLPVRVLNSNNADATLVRRILTLSLLGWSTHFHTNGHNLKSWLLAGICGTAARFGPGGILTLHSGMVPAYLQTASGRNRMLARLVCSSYSRIICVSAAIRDSLENLGVPPGKLELSEAYLGVAPGAALPNSQVLHWMAQHSPLLSTAVFFRPEYGFELLLSALSQLCGRYPSLGCLVMGDGDHRPRAEEQVRAAGLEMNVLLLGDVEHDVCVTIMSRTDVFVRPTLEDGDSVSVREAIGLGVPVVASAVGTRPAAAILFPRGDARALAECLLATLRAHTTVAEKYA